MKKKFSDYYLGLDIGSNSIGWAATDENYKVLRFNGKSMWGVHLFEEGKTAQERRTFRSARRRLDRRNQRLTLLREMFREGIDEVDDKFLQRLQDSRFFPDDKREEQKNSLFNDRNFDDKAYFKAYPTIYHLRSDLIHDSSPKDVRLVYLAIHNILKHRGHFLYEGQEFGRTISFSKIFDEMINTLFDSGIEFNITATEEIEELLKDKSFTVNDKKRELAKLMGVQKDKQKKAVTDLLSGGKISLSQLFDDESLNDTEISKISFSEGIDDKKDLMENILQDKLYIVDIIKSVYDWSILAEILGDKEYLADAKVAIYDEHGEDLKMLKKMTKKYLSKHDYKDIFSNDTKNNYGNYIGKDSKGESVTASSQEDFCKFVIKKFENIELQEESEKKFFEKLQTFTAFPKQITSNNSVIPYQLHKNELTRILDNAKEYLPFLKEKDEQGYIVAEKIKSLLTFRVPYYVGVLNPHSDFAWIIKKSDEKIYPWNFDKVVDKYKSSEEFIKRMTNKCSYLYGEDVLAKNSVLYSRYNILNQLNNLKINGEKISVELKKSIFDKLFIDRKVRVTTKRLKEYIKTVENIDIDFELTGLDNEIQGDMKSLIDFRNIFVDKLPPEEVIDDIIEKIVILGESKDLLYDYLKNNYNEFSDEEIKKISRLNYTGWGRLSRKFLEDIIHEDNNTGEISNIINLMLNTNNNLMQLLSNEYTFVQKIEEYNSLHRQDDSLRQMIEDSYVSPAVKRSMSRAAAITKEIVKITGKEPKKIFTEMARDVENSSRKQRTTSRKDFLIDLYKKAKIEEQYLYESLEQRSVGEVRNRRLYLYYLQLGKCMYSGENINISELYTHYDIDHIIPQSKLKDDSMNNLVLVRRELNDKKGDRLLPKDIITDESVKSHWKMLLDKGFMDKEKYNRLTRKDAFSDDELGGFIARQLVETRQSSKVMAEIFKRIYKDSEIVYVKAGNVSDFRRGKKVNGEVMYDMPKSRLVNDHHHAKDAYLNIVVGNVYHEKFTANPYNFIKTGQKYSLNRVFDYTLKKRGKIVWDAEDDRSYKEVSKQMTKSNVLFTRYARTETGGFFDQNLLKAGKGQFPIKTEDKRLRDIDRYGAYNKVKGAYFFLVEHSALVRKEEQRKRTIYNVPIHLSKYMEKSKENLLEYCKEILALVDPEILIEKIKIDSLFKLNNFYMHLSGRTGNFLAMKNANQLILSDELYRYASRIEKHVETGKRQRLKENPIYIHDRITKEENIILYDELHNKLKNTIYNVKLSAQVDVFAKGREVFEKLNVEEQAEFLYNALSLFGSSPSGKDLKLIGGAGQAGTIKISSDVKEDEQISIVHQSVTGLFEKEVPLNRL